MDKSFPGYVRGLQNAVALMNHEFSAKEIAKIGQQGPDAVEFFKSIQLCKTQKDNNTRVKCVAVALSQGHCKTEVYQVNDCIKYIMNPLTSSDHKTTTFCSNVDFNVSSCLSNLSNKILFGLSGLPTSSLPEIKELD